MEITNALKTVSETDDELIVENHIVLFGGRDLTGLDVARKRDGTLTATVSHKNKDGSRGEFFEPDTEFESEFTKAGQLAVDFEHGFDPDGIGNHKGEVLGYVDWKTARVDDEGIIVRRVLNRRHAYMKWLAPLIKEGLVGNSSQSVKGQGRKMENGKIVKWPLERDTLTVTPMEPRMLTQNALSAVKAMQAMFPQSEDTVLPDSGTPGTQSKSNGEKKMEITEEIKALVASMVSEGVSTGLKARQEADQAAADAKAKLDADLKAAKLEGAKEATEELKAKGLLHRKAYHSTEKTDDDNDGVGAFKAWMRTGQENDSLASPDESYQSIEDGKAAWNVTTGGSGGFLVPDPLYNQIIGKRNIASWVRQAPVQMFTTPSDHLLVPRESTSHTAFVLTAEAGNFDENEGTVSQKDLILYKYTKLEKMSTEFSMFQGTNFESWLMNALGRAEAVTENTIFTTGTGTGQPEGVLAGATTSGLTLAATDTIAPSEMTALIGKLGGGYNVQGECGFLMANATKWYLKGLTGYNFQYAVTPQGGNGTPQDFHGYPAWVDDDFAPYTTESDKPFLFGNMNFYGVVEKPGIVIERNPYLFMGTGQIGIYASMFRGGGVLQAEAFYYMNSHS